MSILIAGRFVHVLQSDVMRDSPRFSFFSFPVRYRGIMVDAARAYLPLTALKGFVVLCRVYKLNRLHIHMTDDGSFTFPSTKYPELAASAQFKYTLAELQELQVMSPRAAGGGGSAG